MTKSKPYRFFTIIMAFVVLLSSTGFGLVEHSCMMRGKSVELAALKKAETACGMCKQATVSGVRSADAPQFKKKACCEETQKHQKIDVVSSSSSFSKILKSLPLSTALGDQAGLPQRLNALLLASFNPEQSRRAPILPKNHGRIMLLFVQSFLI